jgi:hypothetical protein
VRRPERSGTTLIVPLALIWGGLAGVVVSWSFLGAEALAAAIVGALFGLTVLASGHVVVQLVSSAWPGLAVPIALMTYALQVLALAGALVLSRELGLSEAREHRGIALGLVGVAVGWMVGQIRLHQAIVRAAPAPASTNEGSVV